MRFSLRRLFGFVTLGCLALGAILAFGGRRPEEVLRCFLAVILVVEGAAALYAACDPWVGCPTNLEKDLAQASAPRFHSGPVTRTLSVLIGGLFLIVGGFGSMIIVEGGLSFDGGGASLDEWVRGSGLIAATCIGSYARGAGLVGFMALLCGSPLGGRWAALFGLCGGSLIALLVWRLTGDFRGTLTSGIAGLLLLIAGRTLAVVWAGRRSTLGRRSRRRGARGFLLGLAIGAAAATIPAVEWLLFWKPPISLLLGATIGSSLGATLGMLAGVSESSSLGTESESETGDDTASHAFEE